MERPEQIHILRTPDGIDETLNRLRRGPLAVDTETTGLRWAHGDHVGSINLAAGKTAVFAYRDALGPVARWLSDQVVAERELVFHHAKFDLHFLDATFGLHVPYPVHDTAVESFLLDNRGVRAFGNYSDSPHGLKPLAEQFVDPRAQDHEKRLLADIKAKGGKHKGDWLVADERLFAEYSAMDPWYTLELHKQFIERIRYWQQPDEEDWVYPSLMSLYEEERWLILAFRDMEARGIMVHREFLEEWGAELDVQLKKQLRKLAKLAKGKEINWNSPPQIRELLYTKRSHGGLGLRTERRSKGGELATDEVALLTLGHKIGPAIVKYRELNKQRTSYATSLVEAIAPDGAIHATFRSTGTETGRTSCAEPNLQQQTRESGVRKAYHPRKGLKFRFADESQVEMRFAGHAADEPTLVRGFNRDPNFDTHKATAQVMYGIDEPSSQQRKFGKILNFTTLFGGGIKKVAEQLQERLPIEDVMQALHEQHYRLKVGELPHFALATILKERYNNAMPQIRRATRRWADVAEHRGYVMDLLGGHRFIDDKWYRAFNTCIQGTAGRKAKSALAAVYRECQLNRGELALLLLIHDEIVYESEGDPRTDKRVLELMSDHRFRVPIIADMKGSDTNWQDKYSVKVA